MRTNFGLDLGKKALSFVGAMMQPWLNQQFFLASVPTRDVEEFVTELRVVPTGWFAVGGVAIVIALCWFVVWMYRREGRIGASLRVRTGLAVLRCAVLVALVIILLEPVRVRILRRWVDSYTIVLVDDSSSMDLADSYLDDSTSGPVKAALGKDKIEPIRRAELAGRTLTKDNRRFLRKLADRNRVKLYAFGETPTLIGHLAATREGTEVDDRDDAEPGQVQAVDAVSIELSSSGAATNVERALRRTVESLGSAPIAGIVILSDGGFNQGGSAEETARYASERSIPVYTVGIGDPATPRNLRITEMLAPENAFQKDPFPVSVRLASQGLEGETLRVELRERNASQEGEGRLINSKSVTIPEGGIIEEIVFECRQSSVGRYVYSAGVQPLEGEAILDDNYKYATVNVIDARTRVLIVAGDPSWEYQFVSRLLQRDDSFDVSCWLQSADLSSVRDGNTIIDHLPSMADELFEYDVVIMMNPDRDEFDERWCRLMETLVTEYGGGLLVTAGRTHAPDFFRENKFRPLLDMLPVAFDPEADIVLNRVGHFQTKAAPIHIPPAAFSHPIMQLASDAPSTKLIWPTLAGVYWHYPVLREKPAATVLMRHGDARMRNNYGGHVLSAVQFVGAGRAGFLGFDGTWRWRRAGEEHFNRFWVQFVRYLAEGKLLGGTKRGMILTERDEYSLGETITVSARLFDFRYEPLKRDEMSVRVNVDGDNTQLLLKARRDQPGWFEGRFVPKRTGSHRLSLTMPGAQPGEVVEVAREVRVSRPNIEILRPQMDRDALTVLAEQSHGGQYFDIHEASAIPNLIPDLHEEIPIRSRPTTLWDNQTVLTILLTLLIVEWGVRKWKRML